MQIRCKRPRPCFFGSVQHSGHALQATTQRLDLQGGCLLAEEVRGATGLVQGLQGARSVPAANAQPKLTVGGLRSYKGHSQALAFRGRSEGHVANERHRLVQQRAVRAGLQEDLHGRAANGGLGVL